MNIHEELKRLDPEQVKSLMGQIGVSYGVENCNEIHFSTCWRGGDSFKCYYYKDSKSFYDYSGEGSVSLVDIWSVANGRDQEEGFKESVKEISQLIGVNYRKGVFQPLFVEEEEIVDSYEFELCPQETLNKDILNYWYDIPCQKWIDEGISEETQKKFGIRWDWSNGSAIIPVKNIEGELIGVTQRSFNPEVVEKGLKYFPATFDGEFLNYKTSDNLFGIDICKEAIKRSKSVILVEGEKSVMKGYEFWGDKSTVLAVKSFRSLSRWQTDMLKELGVMSVFIAFDKDYMNIDNSQEAQKFREKRIKVYNSIAKDFPFVYAVEGLDSQVGTHENVFDGGIEIWERSPKCKVTV